MLQLGLQRHAEVDDRATRSQEAAVVGIQNGTPTGRQHDILPFDQFRNDLTFPTTEPLLALMLKYFRDRHSGALLQHCITVEEFPPHRFRQHGTDRRLPCAHRADQKHIGRVGGHPREAPS